MTYDAAIAIRIFVRLSVCIYHICSIVLTEIIGQPTTLAISTEAKLFVIILSMLHAKMNCGSS